MGFKLGLYANSQGAQASAVFVVSPRTTMCEADSCIHCPMPLILVLVLHLIADSGDDG